MRIENWIVYEKTIDYEIVREKENLKDRTEGVRKHEKLESEFKIEDYCRHELNIMKQSSKCYNPYELSRLEAREQRGLT